MPTAEDRVAQQKRRPLYYTGPVNPAAPSLIEREYVVEKRNGERTTVNRFDFNLASCADPSTYIQCADSTWVRIDHLRVVPS